MKNWGHLSSFHLSFLSYGPKVAQKSAFCNFVLISARKLSLLKLFNKGQRSTLQNFSLLILRTLRFNFFWTERLIIGKLKKAFFLREKIISITALKVSQLLLIFCLFSKIPVGLICSQGYCQSLLWP